MKTNWWDKRLKRKKIRYSTGKKKKGGKGESEKEERKEENGEK